MKKPRYTDSQIMTILKQAEGGTPVAALCREHGMSSASYYKWRAKYGGSGSSFACNFTVCFLCGEEMHSHDERAGSRENDMRQQRRSAVKGVHPTLNRSHACHFHSHGAQDAT